MFRHQHHAQVFKRIVSFIPILMVDTIAFGYISKGFYPYRNMKAHSFALISTRLITHFDSFLLSIYQYSDNIHTHRQLTPCRYNPELFHSKYTQPIATRSTILRTDIHNIHHGRNLNIYSLPTSLSSTLLTAITITSF